MLREFSVITFKSNALWYIPYTLWLNIFSNWLYVLAVWCYDNSCNALQYALNREPQFVRNVSFLMDAWHFKCHEKCCTAYNSAQYKQFQNSQLAEQQNSKLDNIKCQVGVWNCFRLIFTVVIVLTIVHVLLLFAFHVFLRTQVVPCDKNLAQNSAKYSCCCCCLDFLSCCLEYSIPCSVLTGAEFSLCCCVHVCWSFEECVHVTIQLLGVHAPLLIRAE